ncbi:response regulator [Runella salmonicolor]|uniref:Response regulator n=1 Tax=Runella salmonicolor TaxID=2950278 RepID=A0ABT1FS39_9BACT|nr:response regulator [Runella salmonicolor]MCP1384554.1 response regulator [Runella salmonicolor]
MKTILLIEDNPDMRDNTTEILELAHYNVITAENGKQGIKLAQESSPDLIICDIMMPELDGYGVLHLLSKEPSTASIPFIFLTAKAEKNDYRKGMTLGADDYLTKPYDDVELLSAVETRLRKNNLLKTEYSRTEEGLYQFLNEAKSFESLKKLSENKKTKLFKKREIIYSEGNYPNAVYFLKSGKVKNFKTNEFGKEYIIELHKPGDFFGYLDLLENTAYQDSAVTLQDSEVVIIPKDEFNSLLYNNRDVASKFIKILSNEVREREERLLKLAYNSVRKRVAESLIMLANRYQEDKTKHFAIAITREDLASIVGTATETVIRTLSDFKEESLIEMKGSLITVLDYEKLARMRN